MSNKRIVQIETSMPTSDGAGVNLQRAIGRPGLRHIDPFLMLDEIRSDDPNDYIAGFPPHPHKGFETLSYMLQGSMAHEDSTGGKGLITTGGVQYMTAGKGIIHSETPKQDSGLLWGFQLWLNLPAKDKLVPARYRDIPSEDIPLVKLGVHGTAKLIAGALNSGSQNSGYKKSDESNIEAKGPVVRDDLDLTIFDVSSAKAQSHSFALPEANHGFIYVYRGGVEIDGKQIKQQQVGRFGEGECLTIKSETETGYLLLSGKPINEPIVQHGPFVMNTEDEIRQAMVDYQNGRLVS